MIMKIIQGIIVLAVMTMAAMSVIGMPLPFSIH